VFDKNRAGKTRARKNADEIWLSTLTVGPRPYVETGVVSGTSALTVDGALTRLRRVAAERDCDAVLGVGLVSNGGGYLAYGTGVTWQ
jgi:hypothetical protein